MPNKANHLKTAIENHATAVDLVSRDEGLAWATTIAFYAALHLVEAAFANNGDHFDNHASRNQHLKQERSLQAIWRHYKPLYDHSLKARYLTDENDSAEALIRKHLGLNGVEDKILNHHLRQVEKSVARILNKSAIFPSKSEAAG